MKKIDIDTWSRKEIFDFFSRASNPFYMVSFRQDVTELYDFAKRRGISFYYALCYLVTKAINRVEAFSYVIRGGEVWQIDARDPSFTDLKPSAQLFHIVTMPLMGSVEEFCIKAKQISAAQTAFIDSEAETDALVYLSCLPWIDITAVTNERDLAQPDAKDESIPHIAWGRFTEQNGRKVLGISIEVNHRLIDGLHIGQFAQELARSIEACKEC